VNSNVSRPIARANSGSRFSNWVSDNDNVPPPAEIPADSVSVALTQAGGMHQLQESPPAEPV
jgi:hypothetical protein